MFPYICKTNKNTQTMEKLAKRTVDAWFAQGMTNDEAHTKIMKWQRLIAPGGHDEALLEAMMSYVNELFLADL